MYHWIFNIVFFLLCQMYFALWLERNNREDATETVQQSLLDADQEERKQQRMQIMLQDIKHTATDLMQVPAMLLHAVWTSIIVYKLITQQPISWWAFVLDACVVVLLKNPFDKHENRLAKLLDKMWDKQAAFFSGTIKRVKQMELSKDDYKDMFDKHTEDCFTNAAVSEKTRAANGERLSFNKFKKQFQLKNLFFCGQAVYLCIVVLLLWVVL